MSRLLSETYLNSLPDPIAKNMEALNQYVVERICKRIQQIGTITPSDAHRLKSAIEYAGADLQAIQKELERITGLSFSRRNTSRNASMTVWSVLQNGFCKRQRRTEMAIKNYTTTIDVYKSLGEIQGALASHGARKIMVDYDEAGKPVGVAFGIETPVGTRGFILPANVDGVRAVFERQKVKAAQGQDERTAWRNIRDWIMAQMAIIEAGQVKMEEVFFPYLTDRNGRTLYQLYQGGQLAIGRGESVEL